MCSEVDDLSVPIPVSRLHFDHRPWPLLAKFEVFVRLDVNEAESRDPNMQPTRRVETLVDTNRAVHLIATQCCHRI